METTENITPEAFMKFFRNTEKLNPLTVRTELKFSELFYWEALKSGRNLLHNIKKQPAKCRLFNADQYCALMCRCMYS